jgi:hypothetical protein
MENGTEDDEVKVETTAAADDGEGDGDPNAEAINSRVASCILIFALNSGGSKLGSILDLLGACNAADDCLEAPTVAADANELFKSIGVVELEVEVAVEVGAIALSPEPTIEDAEVGFP